MITVLARQYLPAVGEPGKRYCLANTVIMLHLPSGVAQGQASDMWNETREVLRIRKYMVDTLSKATGQPPEKLNEELMRNRYFEARDAKEYGIIDQVIRPQSPAPESLDKISKVLFREIPGRPGQAAPRGAPGLYEVFNVAL